MGSSAAEPVILAEPIILVISSDEDFAKPLAEQIIKELSLSCAVAKSFEAAKPLKASVMLVVTNEAASEECSVAVLQVKQPPFKMQELLNDISATRQKQLAGDMVLGRGYRLQPRQKELVHVPSEKTVSLTDKEMKLLQNLAEAGGNMVSKEQLLKQVWGMEAILDTHTLETHIYRLRAKFRELGDDDTIIAASDGGYKLVEK